MTLIDPDLKSTDDGASTSVSNIKLRVPKKVLHFSDGVLEEYSSDEDEVDTTKEQSLVDPRKLTWFPWVWYHAWSAGSTTLSVVDTVGEFFASLFGITTPKFYFEMEEFKRREEQKKKRTDLEKGWSEQTETAPITVPLKKISSEENSAESVCTTEPQ